MTMNGITEFGYLGIEASDLSAWEEFACACLGFMGSRSEDTLALRIDDCVHRLLIEQGSADDLKFSGYDCGDDTTLETIVEQLRARQLSVEHCAAELAERRRVRTLYATHDPAGNRVELYIGLERAATPFQSDLVAAGFNTASGGAGHTFLPSPDRQAMLDFYALLGFQVSDYIVEEVAPGVVVDAAFMHCNPRHHTIAFAAMPLPKKIHHYMVEANSRIDVGRAYDRVLNAGVPLELTLGMHPNDQMFSFYVTTPSGFAIEFGADGRLIEDDKAWEVVTYDCLSSWGHKRPEQLVEAMS